MAQKIPVNGFMITCLKCGKNSVRIETRADGTDFQCTSCGQKLLLRPGDVLKVQFKQKSKESDSENKEDWTKDILKDIYDNWENDDHQPS